MWPIIAQDRDNVICTVTSATTTEIKCLTPPMHANFKLDVPLNVVVEGRLIEDAICNNENGCTFTYTKTDIPTI